MHCGQLSEKERDINEVKDVLKQEKDAWTLLSYGVSTLQAWTTNLERESFLKRAMS
jgi:hypothetical protein